MRAHIPGYQGPMTIEPFAGGQSNPTFRLRTPRGDHVLRRKPMGPLLPSAHAVEREFRVLQALGRTDVPVPRVHALCEDPGVIGSAFYVMDCIPGRIVFDPRLPGLTPPERAAIFASMNDAIARLHQVDPTAICLADFGRPANYLQRQMARWSQQYRLSETTPIPEMDRLIDWLPPRLPDSTESRIVHGDLRLDNMIIHPTEPRIVAILDWELATLGDPLADFGNNALAWHLAPDLFRGLAGEDLVALGIPSEHDYRAAYARATGRAIPDTWPLYLVFNLFRLAAIVQGIARRAQDGTASDPRAAQLGAKARPIAQRAWALAQTLPDPPAL